MCVCVYNFLPSLKCKFRGNNDSVCVCMCVTYSLILVLTKLCINLTNKMLEVCHPSSFFSLFVNTIAKEQQKVCAYNLSVPMVIKDDKIFLFQDRLFYP